ncbi:hypothetical protein [Gloeobacter morelensis]|uniref:Uncharacterized protein n=1 Tax=Gloeobacter morelensis MG652769 TaxID=2781736 RepID=A0ABY3PMG5_9CYAN|nr:hypothetical protein [Gloeobacter morelensis]UFP94871.1 hypothetical protein ISF26_01065 [Gloeobacter morelensis MG652769]
MNDAVPADALRPDGRRIIELGWRQGSILSPDLVKEVLERCKLGEKVGEQSLLIVVTHDCDLNNVSFDNEPFFEFLVAEERNLPREDGNLTWGKNPRKLQFTLEGRVYEVSIHDRFKAPREMLLAGAPAPDKALASQLVRSICQWIAKRYSRAVFADTFNERLRPVKRDMKKKLQQHGARITGIYAAVTNEELGEDKSYKVAIRATMQDQDFDNWEVRKEAQKGFDMVIAKIDSCEGIDVVDDELLPERDLSLSDLHLLKRWDFDDLSYSQGDEDTIAPEGT